MSQFRITFYKNLVSSNGHPYKCLQQSIIIRQAKSIDRAVRAAEHRYERMRRLPAWTLHADSLELEIDGRKVDYQPTRDEITRRRVVRSLPGVQAADPGAC
jgi:hypothetical protein